MSQWRQKYEVKTIPQTTGSIEIDVQSVHIHSEKTLDLTLYNSGKSQSIISNTNLY